MGDGQSTLQLPRTSLAFGYLRQQLLLGEGLQVQACAQASVRTRARSGGSHQDMRSMQAMHRSRSCPSKGIGAPC